MSGQLKKKAAKSTECENADALQGWESQLSLRLPSLIL